MRLPSNHPDRSGTHPGVRPEAKGPFGLHPDSALVYASAGLAFAAARFLGPLQDPTLHLLVIGLALVVLGCHFAQLELLLP